MKSPKMLWKKVSRITLWGAGLKVQNSCMSVRVKLAIAHGRLRDDVKEQQIKTSSEVKQQQPTSQKPPGGSPEGIIINNSIGL